MSRSKHCFDPFLYGRYRCIRGDQSPAFVEPEGHPSVSLSPRTRWFFGGVVVFVLFVIAILLFYLQPALWRCVELSRGQRPVGVHVQLDLDRPIGLWIEVLEAEFLRKTLLRHRFAPALQLADRAFPVDQSRCQGVPTPVALPGQDAVPQDFLAGDLGLGELREPLGEAHPEVRLRPAQVAPLGSHEAVVAGQRQEQARPEGVPVDRRDRPAVGDQHPGQEFPEAHDHLRLLVVG
mmetsp:Transcript_114838/g.234733  ORF Transcript_114838/g.234733 Transcript_114838/m.234733 type:complete len:235 (+) Transcript_114838:422-1126(+)